MRGGKCEWRERERGKVSAWTEEAPLLRCSEFEVRRVGVHVYMGDVHGSAERWAPGCVNAAGKAKQKW